MSALCVLLLLLLLLLLFLRVLGLCVLCLFLIRCCCCLSEDCRAINTAMTPSRRVPTGSRHSTVVSCGATRHVVSGAIRIACSTRRTSSSPSLSPSWSASSSATAAAGAVPTSGCGSSHNKDGVSVCRTPVVMTSAGAKVRTNSPRLYTFWSGGNKCRSVSLPILVGWYIYLLYQHPLLSFFRRRLDFRSTYYY